MTATAGGPPGGRASISLRVAFVLAAAGLLFVLTQLHTPGLNGPPYWPWDWRRLPTGRLYPTLLVAALPLIVALVLFEKRPESRIVRSVAVGLLSLQAAIMIAAVAEVQWPGRLAIDRVQQLILDSNASGYLTDAVDLSRRSPAISAGQLLGEYPRLMPALRSHPRDKPPGAVWSYFVLLKGMNERSVAWLSAGLVMAFTAAGVATTYALVARLLRDRSAGFYAAALLSLCPGLSGFFPNFDSTYLVVSCGMIGLWTLAMETGKRRYAIAFGLLLALMFFYTYNLLVLGIFLLGYGIAAARLSGQTNQQMWRRVVVQATIAIVAAVLPYVVLRLTTGFDPIATLQMAMRNQQENLAHMVTPRRLSQSWNGDFFDFALGAGWLPVLMMAAAYGAFRNNPTAARWRWWLGLTVLQLSVVAATALLQAENARVWAFMLPLVLAPAGHELARWPRPARLTAFVAGWLLLAVIVQNMAFIAD